MIPFNRPSFDGKELAYLAEAVAQGHTAGNGQFSRRAEALLEGIQGRGTALVTTSCTHALELTARLIDLQPGDEVIVPSFTFVSTASAFVWNGARPVFADVRPDTLNMDPKSAESLINDRTRAICLVHYAGVAAEPDKFLDLANRHGLILIEDNAHGLGSTYQGRALGTFGAASALSFHETKNVTCGEGGAILVNDPLLVERAEILRDKGTDRSRFLRGQVDKYTWVDVGSSWVMSDLLAGVLVGQLERFDEIQRRRHAIWARYLRELAPWATSEGALLPVVPSDCGHSAHMFHLRLANPPRRDAFIEHMRSRGVLVVFHYQTLHDSPLGRTLGPTRPCPHSSQAAGTLVRLPLFSSMSEGEQSRVIEAVQTFA